MVLDAICLQHLRTASTVLPVLNCHLTAAGWPPRCRNAQQQLLLEQKARFGVRLSTRVPAQRRGSAWCVGGCRPHPAPSSWSLRATLRCLEGRARSTYASIARGSQSSSHLCSTARLPSATARALGRDGHVLFTADILPHKYCHTRCCSYVSKHYVLPRPSQQPKEWEAGKEH